MRRNRCGRYARAFPRRRITCSRRKPALVKRAAARGRRRSWSERPSVEAPPPAGEHRAAGHQQPAQQRSSSSRRAGPEQVDVVGGTPCRTSGRPSAPGLERERRLEHRGPARLERTRHSAPASSSLLISDRSMAVSDAVVSRGTHQRDGRATTTADLQKRARPGAGCDPIHRPPDPFHEPTPPGT